MAKTREYQIVINGLEQSISQVEALNEKLKTLEERMNALSRSVSVKIEGSGGSTKEENDLQKETLATAKEITQEEKNAAKALEEQRQVRKQIRDEAKEVLAADRLSSSNYGNTMSGLKQELADIKAVMQNTDLGSDKFQELTARAGELTEKLKQLETAYGQWGRNVGNYQSAFDGIQQITVKIGETERTFNSVREASRTLGNELKAMVINGQDNTEQFQELSEAVHDFEMATQRAESAMEDLKKSSAGMDNLLDTFESFGALGSVAGGMKAFLGFDDADIQKSIQSLVALQNVLKGIETLNKQMNTGEGLGKYLASSNKQIDLFIAKITGAQVAQKGLVASTTAGTVAVKAFSMALKGIGLGVLMGGITLAVQGIQKLVGWVQEWIKGNADLVKSEELVKQSVDRTNEVFEDRKKALQQSYLAGSISQEELLQKTAEETNRIIREQIALIENMKSKDIGSLFKNEASDSTWGFDFNVKGLDESVRMLELFGEALEQNKDVISYMRDEWDNLTDAEKRMAEVGSTIMTTVSDTKDEFAKLAQVVGGEVIRKYQEAMETMQYDTKKGKAALRELYEELNSNKWMQSALFNLPQYIPNEAVATRIQGLVTIIRNGMNDIKNAANVDLGQLEIDAMKDGLAKTLAQIDRNEKLELQQVEGNEKAKALVRQKYANQRIKAKETENKKYLATVKKGNNELLQAEKELNRMRVQNMADGLSKRLTQIDYEYNVEYNAIKNRGQRVNELIAELDKKRANERRKVLEEYREQSIKMYNDVLDDMYELERKNVEKQGEVLQKQYDRYYENAKSIMITRFRDLNALTFKPINDDDFGADIAAIRQFESADIAVERLTSDIKELQGVLATVGDEAAEAAKKIGTNPDSAAASAEALVLANIDILQKQLEAWKKLQFEGDGTLLSDDESKLTLRSEYYKKFYKELDTLMRENYQREQDLAAETRDKELRDEEKAHSERLNSLGEWYKSAIELAREKGEDEAKVDAEYQNLLLEEDRQYEELRQNIAKNASETQLTLKRQEAKDTQDIYNEMYDRLLQEMRDYATNAGNKLNVADSLPIFNVQKIRSLVKQATQEYQRGVDELQKIREELEVDFNMGKIDDTEYEQKVREIEETTRSLVANVRGNLQRLSEGEDLGNAISKVNEYTQMVGQAVQGVLGSVWDFQDAAHQAMMDNLNKQIDEQEEALERQRDMTQKYADAVSAIEDELSNSRGDRRQELIDQLNAQMQAQRASLAEEKRIENEKRKLEEKAEKEELKQKKREHKRAIIDAVINTALAVSNALATKPFLPMGPIAAGIAGAMGAVQIALITRQKYARGGQIEGPSHSRGGVPVGNTGIEVEGKEYIIRKESSQPNLQLLSYINNSKRKLTLDDFVEFYDKPSKVRQNISKTRFAEGGQMPNVEAISNEADDKIIEAIDRLASRPYYVSVNEINNVQERVGRVQVLAGMEL